MTRECAFYYFRQLNVLFCDLSTHLYAGWDVNIMLAKSSISFMYQEHRPLVCCAYFKYFSPSWLIGILTFMCFQWLCFFYILFVIYFLTYVKFSLLQFYEFDKCIELIELFCLPIVVVFILFHNYFDFCWVDTGRATDRNFKCYLIKFVTFLLWFCSTLLTLPSIPQ